MGFNSGFKGLNIMHQNRPVGFPTAATWISPTSVFRTLPLVLNNIPVMVSKNLLRMYLNGPLVAFYWRQKEDDEHLSSSHVLPLPTLRSGHWRKGYLKWLGWHQCTVHCKVQDSRYPALNGFTHKIFLSLHLAPFLYLCVVFQSSCSETTICENKIFMALRLLNIHLLTL